MAGLEHLHSRNIIHRDLKPANILFQGSTPRLADFGISRVLKSTSQSGIVAGTPSYMSPEAFDGKRNEQTDIWSVGVIFYQLLTGKLPFAQEDITSLVGAILTRQPEPLPREVPNGIQNIIFRDLAKDVGQRYKTATQMRADLRNSQATKPNFQPDKSVFIVQSPLNTNLPSPVQSTPEKRTNAPHFIYAIVGLLAVIIIIFGFKFLGSQNAPTSNVPSSITQNTPARNTILEQKATPTPILTAKMTTPRGEMQNTGFGQYYKNYNNTLELGVAYRYANNATVYIYDGEKLRSVVTERKFKDFYSCPETPRIIDCAPIYEMPSFVTSNMIEGKIR